MSDGEFQIPDVSFDEERITWTKKKLMETGVEKIAKERLEQKVKHHRSVRNDYQMNPDFELATAAVALIEGNRSWMPDNWDSEECDKMIRKSYEERLVIAGALIAAEIDRLNFKE